MRQALSGEERVAGPNKVGQHPPLSTITVTPVGSGATVTDLVEAILGPGVTYSNVAFAGTQGANGSAGLFTNGIAAGLDLIDEGIMLSSGFAVNATGPNSSDGITGQLFTGGDADLNALVGGGTQDKTVLEFDFVPTANNIYIEYVFASDEYNEYVNSNFNDVFAFFINGTNIALIPTTAIPVAINNVNNGNNPYGSNSSYPQFYLNNDLQNGGPFYDIEADGMTKKFTGTATVTPNVTNRIKIAIADRGDTVLDSWVFVKAESFSIDPPDVPVSNWALFIGIGLILAFAFIRFRRIS
ncbi:MAG: choice-of-anchor L domain-containing protein [Ignavibacteriales bacterium]|nr:choice-of-anchor L domain-containing protein [Ignavibacteriales bacterium]